MSCRYENGEFVDCDLSSSLSVDEMIADDADKTTKKGLFGNLFGKKQGGSAVGNTIRDKDKRENTVRDILDLGALFGLTKSSTGQTGAELEQQRQLERQWMMEMQQRNRQQKASILGMPIWAFVLTLGIITLLVILLIAKLKRH